MVQSPMGITYIISGPLPLFRQRHLLHGLIVVYAVVWLICAINPLYPSDWLLENILIFVAVPLLAHEMPRRPLSDFSYFVVLAFLVLHTAGSHYTYAEVPVGHWFTDTFELTRNHYDRLVHFCFGLFVAFPVREACFRYADMGQQLSGFVTFTIIAASSAIYEVIEMVVALIISPDAAVAFLGVQGDLFDAQKDIALAIIGCLLSVFLSRRYCS